MTEKEYYKNLDESFLEAEHKFFANHTSNQLYDILEETIAVKGLREDVSVFIEIYFGKERDFDQFLHQGKFHTSKNGDLFVTFTYGKRVELAEHCLVEYDKVKTDHPKPEAPDGIRVFQLWDHCQLEQMVNWNVEISVVHPYAAASIAERLEVAFRSFFLPIPYAFMPVSHIGY